MKTFKEYWDSKASLVQINSYLKGLNKMLSVADVIQHLKKHFGLKSVKMDRNGTKVLAIESAKRDYKAEYKKFQSSPERIKYRSALVKLIVIKELTEMVMEKMLPTKEGRLSDLKMSLKIEVEQRPVDSKVPLEKKVYSEN